MNAQQLMETELFKRCADFHGHVCPGLCIGFKAATTAMEMLKDGRAQDEEMVAIVETDACCADAVQVITGCTFGKGNFIYKDYGKMVFTFLSRKSGRSIRVAIRPGAFEPDAEHFALLQKIIQNTADEQEQERFRKLHFKRSCDVLDMTVDDLFTIAPIKLNFPAKAKIERSEACEQCGEPCAEFAARIQRGKTVCLDCFAVYDRGW